MNEYYYLDVENKQHGPVLPSQFASLGINADTMVWCNGLENWMPAGQIPELKSYLMPPPNFYTNQPTTPSQYPAPSNSVPGGFKGFPPPSYLVWAILTTVLCCLPFGIVSIIYASQVDSEWNRGNHENAFRKSRLARNWAIAGAATGLGLSIIYLIAIFCFGLTTSVY